MKVIRILLVLVILVSLFFFIRATDLQQVVLSMQQVGYKFVILILVTFIAALLATIGWRYCMGEPGKNLPLWELFLVRVVGEAVALVNPTSIVVGEAVKVFLLREKEIERKTVVASMLISRAVMASTQLLLFLLMGIFLLWKGGFSWQFPQFSPLFYLVLPGSIGLVLFLMRSPWLRNTLRPTRFGTALAQRTAVLRQKVREVRLELVLFYTTSQRNLALAALFFTVHWIFGGMEFYFILLFLGVKATIMQAILVDMGVVFFKAMGAFVPGQIGIEEYGNKVMLAMIGVPGTEIWVAASILRRARQLFWIGFGLLIYFRMNKKWGSALREP